MGEDVVVKVFVSYSWSSTKATLALASRLIADGVNVVLDRWDLKEGQDKYTFMESCVTDPGISRVLLMCDQSYAEKANNRVGGVGDETIIISAEVYGKANQEKFIPIVLEHDNEGNPCVPAYIKTRVYIDLSDPLKYEDSYESLLRNIYDKPLYKKPELGVMPEWLEGNKTNLFPLSDIICQLKSDSNQKGKEILVKRFEDQYMEVLKTYYSKEKLDGKHIYDSWMDLKEARDYCLEWMEILLEDEENAGNTLCAWFENLYNTLTSKKTFDSSASSYCKSEFELFKIHIWELFVCAVTLLLHYERYDVLNILLSHTYFLIESELGGQQKPSNYARFRHHSILLDEECELNPGEHRLFTLMGKTLCYEREKPPIFSKEKLAQADLFLYQVFNGFDLVNEQTDYRDRFWFPTCYIYAEESVGWEKLLSKQYCEKACVLFGVTTIEELKKRIAKCTYNSDMRYPRSFKTAPAILSQIKLEEIGTAN